jgi:hypothetical protein
MILKYVAFRGFVTDRRSCSARDCGSHWCYNNNFLSRQAFQTSGSHRLGEQSILGTASFKYYSSSATAHKMSEGSIRAAQALGITASACLSGASALVDLLPQIDRNCSGGILAISYVTIPSLLLAPGSLGVRQWQKTFNQGKAAAPPIAMLSSAAFAYLAYKLSKTLNQTKGELYGLAALSTLSIMPYTLVVMRGVNGKLLNKANDLKAMSLDDIATNLNDSEESAKELIDWWGTLNFGRGLLPLVGTIVGAWATFT